MRVLIVGGDRAGSIARAVTAAGMECAGHWRGRRPAEARRALPRGIDTVILIWDRVSHPLATSVRTQAATRGLRVLFCRSSTELRQQLPTIAPPECAPC